MSQHEHKIQEAPVINRNGVDFTLSKSTTGKKHSVPGMDFWFPEVTDEQLKDPNVLQWFGDVVANATNKVTRIIFTDLAIENTVDGVLNIEAWKAAASDFTAGRAKIADLEQEVAEQVDITVALTDKLMKLMEDSAPESEVLDMQNQIQNIVRNIIKPLRLKISDIKAKYAKIVEAREAKAVAA